MDLAFIEMSGTFASGEVWRRFSQSPVNNIDTVGRSTDITEAEAIFVIVAYKSAPKCSHLIFLQFFLFLLPIASCPTCPTISKQFMNV